MDYKELIERLRHTTCSGCMAGTMRDAATAIETLLEERDAAISEIQKDCSKCTYWGRLKTESPCRECWYSSGQEKNWRWRGNQKVGYTSIK